VKPKKKPLPIEPWAIFEQETSIVDGDSVTISGLHFAGARVALLRTMKRYIDDRWQTIRVDVYPSVTHAT